MKECVKTFVDYGRIFDPQKALEESPEIDNLEDMIRDSKEQDKDRLENREKKK